MRVSIIFHILWQWNSIQDSAQYMLIGMMCLQLWCGIQQFNALSIMNDVMGTYDWGSGGVGESSSCSTPTSHIYRSHPKVTLIKITLCAPPTHASVRSSSILYFSHFSPMPFIAIYRSSGHSIEVRIADGARITWSTENIAGRLHSDNWRPWNWIGMHIREWTTGSRGNQIQPSR